MVPANDHFRAARAPVGRLPRVLPVPGFQRFPALAFSRRIASILNPVDVLVHRQDNLEFAHLLARVSSAVTNPTNFSSPKKHKVLYRDFTYFRRKGSGTARSGTISRCADEK